MKEIKDIILAYDEAVKQGKRTALATVVHVEGSSYRRPGARMLVTEDGNLTGAISGGCLEGDALRKALLVMTENDLLATHQKTGQPIVTCQYENISGTPALFHKSIFPELLALKEMQVPAES